MTHPRTGRATFTASQILLALALALVALPAMAQSTDDCFGCHEDPSLTTMDGDTVAVMSDHFENSIHGFLSCTDCHTQSADYWDIPHFDRYEPVDCSQCHEAATRSFRESFHGRALSHGDPSAPSCADCHGENTNPHRMQPLDTRTAENACQRCHESEADAYDTSVHFAAAQEGLESPGCVSCHPTHGTSLPPSTGAVNRLCESCHTNAMEQVWRGEHKDVADQLQGQMSCASCHDVHATHKPELSGNTLEACMECHPGYDEQFAGSVHEELLADGGMNCISCHRTHQVTDARETEEFGCGACHVEAEEEYRTSAHRMARLRGDNVAATCADCHNGHHVLAADDPQSPVYHSNIPGTCGDCHSDQTVMTSDYVRLPISLPSYEASVHGQGLEEGKYTAACTDCHGVHALQSANEPTSMVARQNIAQTCSQCHDEVADAYVGSVHGRAVNHGIKDSPTCTDCHDEHLIIETEDPDSPVSRAQQATVGCAQCHEDPEMAARYGLPREVVASYQDSYHGWAMRRGGEAVATCEDCHNTHNIRSHLDPTSSIHPNNVVETCGRCHDNSNPKFAASYSHLAAAEKRAIHDWVRLIYIWLIAIVLGGMAVHNLIVMIREWRADYRKHKRKPAVERMTKNEVWQHIVLAVSFTGLAITGFALRFPEAWWVDMLKAFGMTEEVRRILHRALGTILLGASVYHVIYLMGTSRGRMLVRAIFPKLRDATEAGQNMLYQMGLRKNPPTYGMYDYTQKAEYWALIWGTAVMGITGIVLWFPELATGWLPVWIVRVSETIHYYEAILAVSAIIIWHFFFTIFLPKEYPMSWIWITGRMEKDEWKHHHGREPEETGRAPKMLPPMDDGENGAD